jgi:hypothetical protein
MADTITTRSLHVLDVIERYGRCLELVPLDPHFHDISVGLYSKGNISTVWTFSRKPGVEDRIRVIRDRLVTLGGLQPVEGTHDQITSPCGQLHSRPTRFLMMRAVERDPDSSPPKVGETVKDMKSGLALGTDSRETDGGVVYYVTAEGDAPNKAARLRAITSGFVRYGEMEKTEDGGITFPCGYRHDELVQLVLSYARNVSRVEDMLEADALRGQMTTSTLGFSQGP